MKRLTVFLVLVGLAVPGLADSTDLLGDWRNETWHNVIDALFDVDRIQLSDPALIFDTTVVVEPYAAVMAIDGKYRRADFNMKLKLKKERDKVFNAYAKGRLKPLEED